MAIALNWPNSSGSAVTWETWIYPFDRYIVVTAIPSSGAQVKSEDYTFNWSKSSGIAGYAGGLDFFISVL